MTSKTFRAALLLAAIAALALRVGVAGADQAIDLEGVRAAKRVTAVRIFEPITIDGVLDEAEWELAQPTSDFYQQEPAEFELATRRTLVRFLYDDETLYVGAMLYDPDPDGLIINDLKRDFSGRDGDAFGLILDTFLDQRNCYGFLTNPGGAQRESQAYDNGRRNDANWHGVWFVKTSIRSDGWSVEYAIPFKTLRFPDSDAQVWGLNMVRYARQANETSTWSPVPRQFNHYNVAYAGTLVGIGRAARSRNLQLKPFATGSFGRGVLGQPAWDGDGDGGLDLKWGMTGSLMLDASYRTDFSQVEADDQQINTTRFSLFFPEKREFFLENQDSFQIGLTEPRGQDRRDLVPFFSRNIGLADGQPIPVVGGARLTGRAGRQSIGVLNMQTEAFGDRPGDNFTAVRVARDVTDQASIAGFYFGREASGAESSNRVAGFDARFAPNRRLQLEAYAMRSETHGAPGDFAARAGLRLDSPGHRARLMLLHVGDAFQHDLGFVRRHGIGTLFGRYERVVRPADTSGRLREVTFGGDLEATTDDGYSQLLTGIVGLNYDMLFADGSQIRSWANTKFERLSEPFSISDLTVETGDYHFEDVGVSYNSNRSAPLSGSVRFEGGEFWSGRQWAVGTSARVRFSANLAASATFDRSDIRLPAGSFVGDLVGMRLDWSFSPRMFLNAFVQYNSESDAWITNIRYNFIHRPLSDIYIVWNETRLPGLDQRALLFKYTHLIAF